MLETLVKFIKTLFGVNLENSYKRVDLSTILPTFDEETEKKLSELYPQIAVKVRWLLRRCESQGLKVGLFEGYRSLRRTQELFDLGRDVNGNVVDKKKVVSNSRPGYSWHNYSLAIDIVMDGSTHPGLQPSWKEFVDTNGDKVNDWKQLGQIGVSLGLVWGGNFKSVVDVPHFQVSTKLTIQQAMALNKSGGLDAVWRNV